MFEFWNSLPEELKLECIKWMDLKTRVRLGGTCHKERLLVPRAEKLIVFSLHIDAVSFANGALRFSLDSSNGDDLWPEFKNEDQIQKAGKPLLSFIFQNSVVHELSNLGTDDRNREMLVGLKSSKPFDIRKIAGQAPFNFFQKCAPNCFRIVDFHNLCDSSPLSIEELMELPSFQAAKLWRLQFKECHDFGACVAKKWIQLDVDVKSTMEFRYVGEDRTINDFVKEMGAIDIVERTDILVRFKTRNQKKHMTMRRMHWVNETYLFTLAVIPADLEEKNYESYIDL
ncbi:hypothetical protein CAEBREN_20514 [Caenorhabditis brenneri]|uniref:F-box domain-containing protein n=1 Tax=Caenorhabditis brenneri TaxID=135651 RepID=G0NIM6_CAEBE|nr:hypothetical protein CAEBREN_20514 [Caenorhabditis brenneri]